MIFDHWQNMLCLNVPGSKVDGNAFNADRGDRNVTKLQLVIWATAHSLHDFSWPNFTPVFEAVAYGHRTIPCWVVFMDKQGRLVCQLLWGKLGWRGARGFHGWCLSVLTLRRELGFRFRESSLLIHMLAVLWLGTADHRGAVGESHTHTQGLSKWCW